jgi:ribosomal protein S18 acetylase RimI-like enzyme
MHQLTARPAGPEDLERVERLCLRAVSSSEEGLGYPRCENREEMLAELAVYGLELAEGLWVLEGEQGQALGVTGLLFSHGDTSAFVIGPMLEPAERTPERMREAVARVEALAGGRFTALRNAVLSGNVLLSEALREAGWLPEHQSLEMEFRVPEGSARLPADSVSSIHRVTSPDDPVFPKLVHLLATTQRWREDPEARLREYLREGYRMAWLERGGELAGCAVWVFLEGTDFGRLEYVSTAPNSRRQGVGGALVEHVLQDASRAPGVVHMYLSLDPANESARRLYGRLGFIEGPCSSIYVKREAAHGS